MMEIVLFVIGVGITFLLGKILDHKMKAIKDNSSKYIKPPEGIDEKKWTDAFIIHDDLQKNTELLGLLERFVFLCSIWITQPTIIGIWLAFKVASKWQAWQNIIKIPDKLCKNQNANNKIDPLDEFKARNIIASYTLQRWFLGTLGNIVVAIVGSVPIILYRKHTNGS